MRWAAPLVLLAACGAPGARTDQPAGPEPLLKAGDRGIGGAVSVASAALAGGRYTVVLQSGTSRPLAFSTEIRFRDAKGQLLIPALAQPQPAQLKPYGELTLAGPCPFPEAVQVLVRLIP